VGIWIFFQYSNAFQMVLFLRRVGFESGRRFSRPDETHRLAPNEPYRYNCACKESARWVESGGFQSAPKNAVRIRNPPPYAGLYPEIFAIGSKKIHFS
jgi:hypothetical protein